MRRMTAVIGLVAAIVVVGTALPLHAQEPGLDRVERLVTGGNVSGARDALAAWWESNPAGTAGTQRQRALWLRARLTVDPSIARRDYTRLIVEHPGGPYSAEALLRLAQVAEVEGREQAARRHYEQLLREYPDSPHRLDARRRLDEASRADGPPAGETPAGPGVESSGRPAVESGLEQDRRGTDSAASAESREPSPPARGSISIQLGAFSTEERARTFAEDAAARGVSDIRLVRTPRSDLVRVRTGRFSDRGGAAELVDRLRSLGFPAVVVTDADAESAMP